MCKNVDGLNGKAGKAIDVAVAVARIITPLLLTAMGWAWWNHETRISSLSLDVAVVESNRFTAGDGLAVWQEISRLKEGKAPAMGAVPVLKDIEEIKRRVERLEQGR